MVSVPPALESLLGPPEGEPEALGGGITNRNYRVRFGGRDCVMRLAGPKTELLGIDRRCERMATEAAAALGIAPAVVAFLEDPPCLVTEFIPGRALARDDLSGPDVLAELAVDLMTIHDAGSIPSAFSPFAVIDLYRARAQQHGAVVPGAFGDLRAGARRIERALDPAHPENAPVLCHNDLLSANFLHDGERVRIIDWEYAGMGNRYFDLGNLSVNNGLDEEAQATLLEAYFGEPPDSRRLACVRLMRFMSDFRESMWGVVQSAVSELDFDFSGYVEKHFARLGATAADPRFKAWLQEARAAGA